MQVTGNQLNDVGEPVLTDGCDDVDGDLLLDVLSVAGERLASSLDSPRVGVGWLHDRVILFKLISRLSIML